MTEIDELGAEAIQTIEDRDTPDARAELALGYTAQLKGQIQEFAASQNALGGPCHIDGIKRTGWTPWGRFFKVASYVLMTVDALLWFLCGSRALVKTFWIILLLIAVAFAFAGKSVGKYLATVRLVDPTSGKQTIRRHIAALKWIVGPLVVTALLAILMFFAPLALTPMIIALFWIPLITLNCLIGYTAGVCDSVGMVLLRPRKYDELEHEILRRVRLREILKRYLPKKPAAVIIVGLALTLTGSASRAAGGDACGIFVDETRSVDPADRKRAVEFVLGSISDYIAASGCTWVVVGKFAGDGRFEPKTWIRAPHQAKALDCQRAEPEPLTGHASLLNHIRSVTLYRKQQAVQACEREQQARSERDTQDKQAFQEKVREALTIVPRSGPTRLTGFLQELLADGLYRSAVVISDGIDNPPVPSRRLAVPKRIGVTLIIVRPDARYGTISQSLVAVRQWAKVPGIRVITPGELRPGLWADLGAR